MKTKLSLLMISRKNDELREKALTSVKGLVDEIVIMDNDIEDLGKKRIMGLKKVKNNWVLVLDSDEMISPELKKEISSVISSQYSVIGENKKPKTENRQPKTGYLIPFQNHFLGRPVNHGGENYKMLRLFNKNFIDIKPALVHEGFKLKNGIPGELKNKIFHYSYRSLRQVYGKFTDYAVREAKQKISVGEKPSFIKVFTYPLHMFWARYIKDGGYRDGLFRIPLDIGFAYMEMMTYVLLWLYSPQKLKMKNEK